MSFQVITKKRVKDILSRHPNLRMQRNTTLKYIHETDTFYACPIGAVVLDMYPGYINIDHPGESEVGLYEAFDMLTEKGVLDEKDFDRLSCFVNGFDGDDSKCWLHSGVGDCPTYRKGKTIASLAGEGNETQ